MRRSHVHAGGMRMLSRAGQGHRLVSAGAAKLRGATLPELPAKPRRQRGGTGHYLTFFKCSQDPDLPVGDRIGIRIGHKPDPPTKPIKFYVGLITGACNGDELCAFKVRRCSILDF